jgi:hypothetical protein
MIRYAALVFALLAVIAIQMPSASYAITHVTTQVTLNTNTSATVREVFTVYITNSSASQYQADRAVFNLTLSTWQSIIGPGLTQHIINPKLGVYSFRLFPGPLTTTITGQQNAQIILSYNVQNVTRVNEIAPRVFFYTFNTNVFNFEHEISGQVLDPNTTLTISPPQGSIINNIYPVPDSPSNLITGNFTNVTSMSWYYQEPLSKFALSFTTRQSIQAEVLSFFTAAYAFLGIFTYVIIIAFVLFFILYTYLKVEK